MTKRRFPAQRIALAPRQTRAGAAAAETSGDSRNGGATHGRRRETDSAVTPSDLERLKQLEEDYNKLKQIVAGLNLD